VIVAQKNTNPIPGFVDDLNPGFRFAKMIWFPQVSCFLKPWFQSIVGRLYTE